MYIIKQQLTMEFNAHVERLTADLTTWDAIYRGSLKPCTHMTFEILVIIRVRVSLPLGGSTNIVNTVIETINKITTNYESLRDQLDQITEMGSVALLISDQFAGPSVPTSNFSQRSSGSSSGSSGSSLDDMCNIVSVEICGLEMEKISKKTIKNFYYNDGDFRGSTLNKIGAWVDSKNNFNLANSSE
ncbi:hypothetical protein C2G38_2227027 [Gigaspora rosea]|uniref:Uncharacterized protein n=1 Tax=Gigaspora rosea TaxID=44941 RepID=A0A397TXF7_9GLOM|nr:hypothetical protein C2G38_2227027 [Gigaspora rosea]